MQIAAFFRARRSRLGFAFLCGFAGTLLVHAFAFLNHFTMHDQVRNVFAIPATVSLGRWLMGRVIEIGSRLGMPWLNGLLLAAALGLAVAVLAELFQLTRRLPILLCATILVTYPTLTESILYIYLADVYGYTILLVALAALLTDRWRLGFLPGAVCLCLSLGIYQAYLPLALGWLTVRGLQRLLTGRESNRALLALAARYALLFALGLSLYLGVLKVVVAVSQVPLSDYMGVSAIGQIDPRSIGHLLKTAYLRFFHHFLTEVGANQGGVMQALNVGVLAFDACAILWLMVRRVSTTFQRLCTVAGLLLLPLLFDSIYLLNAATVHQLMTFCTACPYWLALVLAQAVREEAGAPRFIGLRRGVAAAMACVLLATGFGYTVYANQVYYLYSLDFEATEQYASRLVARLESREDFTLTTPVLFAGKASRNPYGNIPFYKQGMPRFADMKPFSVLQSDSHTRGFMRSYLGLEFAAPDAATTEAILQSEQLAAMPAYPAQGCIQPMDGVLVVKLGNP